MEQEKRMLYTKGSSLLSLRVQNERPMLSRIKEESEAAMTAEQPKNAVKTGVMGKMFKKLRMG